MPKKLRRPTGQIHLPGLGSETVKAFTAVDEKWEPIQKEDFLVMKVEDFVNGVRRLLVSFNIGDQLVIICSREKDGESARSKFKNACVVHFDKLIGFFRSELTADKIKMIPSTFLALEVFPGAKVIS